MKRVLEKALNHYLALDPESKRRLLLLQGKAVTIELLAVALTFQLIFIDGKIELRWNDFNNADMTIKGTPLSLLHMSLAPEQRQRFFAEDVIVEGNMELARHVLALFDELEIDVDEFLSRYVGDVPAYQIGRTVRGIKKFSQKCRETLLCNVNEYVHEEINLFPPREALLDFFQDVDELRMDADRLEARVNKLLEFTR